MESYFITSKTHTYNLVNIGGKYIYTYPTYLDNEIYHKPVYSDSEKLTEDIKLLSGYDVYIALDAINKGYGYELNWYLEDPSQYYDESHVSVNVPSHIKIERFDNKNV